MGGLGRGGGSGAASQHMIPGEQISDFFGQETYSDIPLLTINLSVILSVFNNSFTYFFQVMRLWTMMTMETQFPECPGGEGCSQVYVLITF